MTNFMEQLDPCFDGLKVGIRNSLNSLDSFLKLFSNFWFGALIIVTVFVVLLVYTILRSRMLFKTQIKNIRTLAICALLVALNVILGFYTIHLSSYLRIGFGFITVPFAAALFGPGIACMTGVVQDVVSFLVMPTGGYLFTYTLNVGVGGLIYGLMLYGRKVTFWRVLLTKLIVVVFINIILSSIAIAPTVGAGLIGILPARIIKNLLLWPIQSVIVYLLLKIMERIRVKS